ncbi:MAG: hypothetical protein RL751_1001, partial [Bacteroidota bacterium]
VPNTCGIDIAALEKHEVAWAYFGELDSGAELSQTVARAHEIKTKIAKDVIDKTRAIKTRRSGATIAVRNT